MEKSILKVVVGALVWMMISVGTSLASIEAAPQKAESFIQSFFEKLTAGETEAAVQLVESLMINPDESAIKHESLVLDLSNIGKLFGKHTGLEKLYSEYRGEGLLVVR